MCCGMNQMADILQTTMFENYIFSPKISFEIWKWHFYISLLPVVPLTMAPLAGHWIGNKPLPGTNGQQMASPGHSELIKHQVFGPARLRDVPAQH